MPSIEIACIGLDTLLEPPTTSFALIFEAGLKSHRSPDPRFQRDFDELSGSLYHLGNPQFAGTNTGAFLAYDVLSEASRHAEPTSFLEFAPEHRDSARKLLSWLLQISPEGRLLFTSDWQFGPEGSHRFPPTSLAEFWRLHNAHELQLNSAYPIERAA
jgi:hypothetical protein